MGADAGDPLNDNQKRHLLAFCQYVDRLLGEMEGILAGTGSVSPFNTHIADVPPAQQRVIRDYIARMRREMLRALSAEGAEPQPPSISALFALRTHLSFIDSGIEELKPKYMAGYGALGEAVSERVGAMVSELQATIAKLDQQLSRGAGDIDARLTRLEAAGQDIELPRLIGDIIDRYGLTEFRPALDLLLERLGDRHFEVAVFGRVSTGKSSLLNHLLHLDVLPVGVNPITAIPTRVLHGESPRLEVDFLSGRHEVLPLAQIGEFASEEQNPGNTQRVSRLAAYVPSSRLRDGVVFVDTPGLGSLATTGAAETLAYLPRCDFAMVLIDAASTLTPEDIATVRALCDAGVSTIVLLSKADLLAGDAVTRVRAYVAAKLEEQLGTTFQVFPVSVAPTYAEPLERWYADEVVPRLASHDEMRAASLARKIGALAETLASSLERMLSRRPTPAQASDMGVAELRALSLSIDAARSQGDEILLRIPAAWKTVLRHAADRVASDHGAAVPGEAADATVRRTLEEAMALLAAPLLERVKTLAADVAQRLRAIGAAADGNEGLDAGELLRELPRPDLGALHLRLRVGAVRLFGKGAIRASLARALEEQAGSEIQAATSSYAALLRQWYMRTLQRVRTAFEMAADAYRAPFQAAARFPGDAGAVATLAADLERFRGAPAMRHSPSTRDKGAA